MSNLLRTIQQVTRDYVDSISHRLPSIKNGSVTATSSDGTATVRVDGDTATTASVPSIAAVKPGDRVKMVLFNRQLTILGAIQRTDGSVTYHGNASNGAVRYPDGTQIAWLAITTNISIDIPYAGGAAFQGLYTWAFAAEFSSTPAVSCGRFQHSSTASWGMVAHQESYNENTHARLRGMDFSSRPTGTTRISAIAVGRWK